MKRKLTAAEKKYYYVRINQKQHLEATKEYVDHFTNQFISEKEWPVWLKHTEPTVDEIKILHDPTGGKKEFADVEIDGNIVAMSEDALRKALDENEIYYPDNSGINKLAKRLQKYYEYYKVEDIKNKKDTKPETKAEDKES